MDFNRYFDNNQLRDTLGAWAQDYPNLLELEVIGESYEERPIDLLVITNRESGDDRDKPAVWIDANLHATEIAGTTTALYIAYALLSGYGQDDRVTRLVDAIAFYILPRVNPDGAHLAMSSSPRYLRSGVRPYPWREKDDGLHQQDIDGDGRVLQMRMQDPNGDWKISSLDSRLMEKRAPDEHGGTYYRLLPEGILENYDGDIIKIAPPLEGLDFNRNFPFEWRPEAEQSGAGPYPASEPEIKVLMDFIVDHPNINVAMTYHTFGRVILRPYSTKPDDEMDTSDLWVYQKMTAIGAESTGYRGISTYHDFKYHPKEVTTGAFDDWLYDHLGIFTFTTELWDLPTQAGIDNRKFIEWFRDHPHEDDLKILNWVHENCRDDAYVDWYAFDHPQLGQIELGGWNDLYTWRNPPPNSMEEEASKNLPFILSLAELLPHLCLNKLKVTPLDDQTYHLHLVVENTGYLPTFTSQQGKKRKSARPVRVDLTLPEKAEILSGKPRDELGHLEGRSNKFSLTFGASPTDNRARYEWVVRAPKGDKVHLNVLSERAGVIRKEIEL